MQKEEKESVNGFVVPPYLIPMSKEFLILEDSSQSGFISREFMIKEAGRLGEALTNTDKDGQEKLYVSISKDISERIGSILGLEAAGDGTSVLSLLQIENGVDPKLNDLLEETSEPQPTTSIITKESTLLSLFGWRLMESNDETTGEGVHVTCRFCLNTCQVSHSESDESTTHAPKRRRVNDGPVSNSASKFHLVESHRHFCPFISGFVTKEDETEVSGTSNPCWEILLASLCRGANRNIGKGEKADERRKTFDGEQTFQSIRKTLRSSLLSAKE